MCRSSNFLGRPLSVISLLIALTTFQESILANPAYDIVELGLTDAEHTSSRGNQSSQAFSLSATGIVAGHSDRYIGTAVQGNSAWVYDSGSLIRLGYTGPEYVATDGKMDSSIELVTNTGQVFGYSQLYEGYDRRFKTSWVYENGVQSELILTDPNGLITHADFNIGDTNETGIVIGFVYRYSGSVNLGRAAWYYENGSVQEIGLTDALHTRDDGYRRNHAIDINESGHILGTAQSFPNTQAEGQSIWVFDGQSTMRIGLLDSAHTSSSGLQYSTSSNINALGQAAGLSTRFDGENSVGQTAWMFDGTTSFQLGYYDSHHTRSDGWQYSKAWITETGGAIGISTQYTPTDAVGQTAWYYDGNSTVQLGFQDAIHTTQNGVHESGINSLGSSGYLFGWSTRFQPSGRTAWVYDGISLSEVGLTSGEHTSSYGFRYSYVEMANDAGQAAGISERYIGATDPNGISAWFWANGQTTRVGLNDASHTRDDGWQLSNPEMINEVGLLAGFSLRYSGTDQAGQSAWLYDSQTDQTYPVIFSERSDGYAFSEVGYLSDNGLALGYYKLFDPADDAFLGTRAFGWTRDDGAFDLGMTISGGLDEAGWALLADAIEANSSGWIIGHGELLGAEYYTPFPGAPFGYYVNQRDLAYVLIPANESIAGDLDGDGFVGIADLNIVLGNWNQNVTPGSQLDGDPSGDGFVGIEDLNTVLGNWNAGTPPIADDSLATVPEPSSMWLATLGLIALRRRARLAKQ